MVTRWWEERSAPQRFDLYTRSSLYAMAAVEPLIAALVAASATEGDAAGGAVYIAASVLHAAVALVVLRGAMAWYLGRRDWPGRETLLLVVVTPVAPIAAAAAFGVEPPGAGEPGARSAAGLAMVLAVGFTVAATSPRLPTRRLLVLAVVAAAAIGAMALAVGWPARNSLALVVSALLAFVSGWSAFRVSVWTLGVIWELERSRRVQAELAVAEERLRFSRDLHDILGRNLSVIAVKSELAAALTRHGRDEAGTEMMAVRDIAQESLREVRDVVRGYREVDLTTELAGARSVLRSAGVSTRVVGDGDELPAEVQSVLGWVAREGTTNVLRHSQAHECLITVTRSAGAATLTMENDGVLTGGAPVGDGVGRRDGSGLTGLDERLHGMGGELSAGPAGAGRFRLTARVPVPSPGPPSLAGPSPAGEARGATP
ncbi:sensor histidine kinase [Jiangella asiatica]|uniref:Sensor histidine kinase n=1 Tax=Jiangella asiatica TaxID=2530372 RepID=A0A4R5DEH0_9ACTN|nr:histidine kinase [Jiangella asiatica]TDE12266.1 sensor histidine kinase [Jiangella asiatica]